MVLRGNERETTGVSKGLLPIALVVQATELSKKSLNDSLSTFSSSSIFSIDSSAITLNQKLSKFTQISLCAVTQRE